MTEQEIKKLALETATNYFEHAGSDDECDLNDRECLADYIHTAVATALADRPAASQGTSDGSNPNIPRSCSACGKPLALENLYVDDGCPCNSPRGVNFKPQPCRLCKTDNCVKPGHRLNELFGVAASQPPQELEGLRETFDKITCQYCKLGFERLTNGMHVSFTCGTDGIAKFRHEDTPCQSKATEILAALTRGEVGQQ